MSDTVDNVLESVETTETNDVVIDEVTEPEVVAEPEVVDEVPESAEAAEEPVATEEPEEPEPEPEEPEPEEPEPEPEPEPVVVTESEVPVEQVVSEIRDILTEEHVISESTITSEADTFSTDNLCSLKTLVDVLGKWSSNEIRRRNVEELLKEGSEVDENLDDIEKVVEVLKCWIREGGSTFINHNHFKNLDEYTLVDESRELPEEKKSEILKTLTELVINVSQRRITNEEIQNVLNTLY